MDDVCNFGMANLMGNPELPFAIKIKAKWSKYWE